MNRRTLLSLLGASCGLSLSGCLGDDETNTAGNAPNGNGTNDSGTEDDENDSEPTSGSLVESTSPGTKDECAIERSTDRVDSSPIRVDGRFEDADVVVDLRWNARSQKSVKDDPDDVVGGIAEEGEKILVLKLKVTNTAEEVITIDTDNFELSYETADTIDTISPSISYVEEIDVNIKPGGTVQGIVTFLIPADATTATLQPQAPFYDDRKSVAFNPTCDDSLTIDIPDTLDSD